MNRKIIILAVLFYGSLSGIRAIALTVMGRLYVLAAGL